MCVWDGGSYGEGVKNYSYQDLSSYSSVSSKLNVMGVSEEFICS